MSRMIKTSKGHKFVFTLTIISAICLIFPVPLEAYIAANNSPASVVTGQANMTSNSSNQGGSVAANTLYVPMGAYSDGTRLFVADYFNNRVLIYNSIPTSNNASADVVVGQPDMTSSDANQGGAVAANTLYQPYSVYSDGTKLFICDYLNSRILIYNSIPTSNNASADVVVGQADMSSGDRDRGVPQPTAAANGLDRPTSVYSDGTKLYVADEGNHRALIFNTVPTSNGASADVVVGQTLMTGYQQNQGLGGLDADANTLSQPYEIKAFNSKLYIADYGNNRVLIFNSIPTSNNASANVVIGQPNMTVNDTNQGGTLKANTLFVPGRVHSDGTRLLISDLGNNRVLLFNSIPTSNNASANVVIGQQNMTSGSANQGGSPSSSTINTPRGVHLLSNKLIITDSSNHRILFYDVSPGITNSSTPGVGPISINSGDASTGSRSVTLTLNADGAKDMMISNDPNFAGASWESYATTRAWTLSSGNSIKTVYVKFRDFALFESARYSDGIDLPTQLPDTGESAKKPINLLIMYIFSLFLSIINSAYRIKKSPKNKKYLHPAFSYLPSFLAKKLPKSYD
jgi:hypothetical protein